MPDENSPLMDAAALSKARPLLWLWLTISVLVFLAVAVETLGDLADTVTQRPPATTSAVVTSAAIAVVLLGLLAWLAGMLVWELVSWGRAVASPQSFVELTGTVVEVRKVLGLPQFLSTTVRLNSSWRGRTVVKLITANSTEPKGKGRMGEIAPKDEQLRIQVYDSGRRRTIAVAAADGRPAHRANLLV